MDKTEIGTAIEELPIEWYQAQVAELKDIRKFIWELTKDEDDGKDWYFPDKVKKVITSLQSDVNTLKEENKKLEEYKWKYLGLVL